MAELGNAGHFSEEDLLWFFYGEAANAAEIDLHLTLCRECRAEFERLKSSMAVLSTYTAPQRSVEYGQQVWRELVRRDASIASRRRRFRWGAWFEPRKLAVYAFSVVLLLAAFTVGRITRPSERTAPTAAVIRERLLAVALADHLEQSERTLVEIANASSNQDLNLSREQERAEVLLQGNRLYRQAAAAEGHTALAAVLDDLERVLLEVAHASENITPTELEQLRSRVEDQQLLFRLRVINLRLRELQNEPLRSSKKTSLKG